MQWLFTTEYVLYLFEDKIKVNCTLFQKVLYTQNFAPQGKI